MLRVDRPEIAPTLGPPALITIRQHAVAARSTPHRPFSEIENAAGLMAAAAPLFNSLSSNTLTLRRRNPEDPRAGAEGGFR
jgi:hypothetical protein